MSHGIHNVTDASFREEVLDSPLPVLVEYGADWCGPCKMMGPILDDSASAYAGQLKIAKIDIDRNPRTPSRYHVRGIPTLMLFKRGEPVATQVGAVGRAHLSALLDAHL